MGIPGDIDRGIFKRPDGDREISTGIRAFGLKGGITPEDLNRGLAEIVVSFYENGKYRPARQQPPLAFYDGQEILFEFTGKSKIGGDDLITQIKTNFNPLFSPPKRYSLDVSLVTKDKGSNLGWQLLDQVKAAVCEFAGKYTNFVGYFDRSE